MTINKKLLLGLGAAAIAVAPVVAVVSCSSDTPAEKKSLDITAKATTGTGTNTVAAADLELSGLKTNLKAILTASTNWVAGNDDTKKTALVTALSKYFILDATKATNIKNVSIKKGTEELDATKIDALLHEEEVSIEIVGKDGYSNVKTTLKSSLTQAIVDAAKAVKPTVALKDAAVAPTTTLTAEHFTITQPTDANFIKGFSWSFKAAAANATTTTSADVKFTLKYNGKDIPAALAQGIEVIVVVENVFTS